MGAFSETDFDLPPGRVREIIEAGEAQLVDVREPYEWEAGRIAGAVHIELEHLAGHADELDREKPVIFHCRLGRRSALATDAFRAVGFDAYNMKGGLLAWADEGLPLEPEDGQVADHGQA